MTRQDDATKCLAIALLNLADDEGYFLADPGLVRSFARPIDEESSTTRRLIAQLEKVGWIEVSNHSTHGLIGRVVNFQEHQSIDRPKPSKIKEYFSTNDRRTIDDDSSLEQGTGNREVQKPSTADADSKAKVPKPKVAKAPEKPGPSVNEILAEHDPASYWATSKAFPGARSSNHRTAAVYWVAAINSGVTGPLIVQAAKQFMDSLPPDQVSRGAIPQCAKWLSEEGFRSFLPEDSPMVPRKVSEAERKARLADADAFLAAKCLNPSLTLEAWRASNAA